MAAGSARCGRHNVSNGSFASVWPRTDDFRGRDASYLAPPAQIRASPIRAHGLYGAFFVKGGAHHFVAPSRPCLLILLFDPRREHSSAPTAYWPSPSRAARVKDGASSAPPKACP